MQINRNSRLVDIAEAVQGDWTKTISKNTIVLEMGFMKIVRVQVTQEGGLVLPIKVESNTPYNLYTKDGVYGGVLTIGQSTLKVEHTGVLEYIVI